MDIKEMTIEELEARKSEIATELDAPEADLDALEAEARSIKEEIEARAAIEAKKNEIRAAVAGGAEITAEQYVVELCTLSKHPAHIRAAAGIER